MSKGAMFSVLLVCISATCQADTLARDGNGNFVGFYTGILEHGGSVIVSAKGYRFVVTRGGGTLRGPVDDTFESVYFHTTDCSGAARLYTASGVAVSEFAGVMIPIRGGNNFELQALYYAPQNAASSIVQLNSRLDGAPGVLPVCTQIGSTQGVSSIPLVPNDPAVTGVPTSDFVPPITVTSNTIFKNGFDTALAQAVSASEFA